MGTLVERAVPAAGGTDKAGTAPPPKPKRPRDPRLDFFRGLCLVMIYINHVPGTIFEHVTSRNFGLSDAAEGFVFMSGCAAALAFSSGTVLETARRTTARAWTLYQVHILTTLLAIVMVGAAVLYTGDPEVLSNNTFEMLWEDPRTVSIGIVTLGHQFGYMNILPMYMALMLVAPGLIWLGRRKPLALLAVSIGIWVLAANFRINLPNYPLPGGWFFNPFSWQLLFTLGILTGLGLREGRRFVPASRVLLAIVVVWLAYCVLWVQVDAVKAFSRSVLAALREEGAMFLFVSFDKSFVAAPRLLHFVALAYLLSWPRIIPWVTGSWVAAPIRLLGKYGLWVFATGTVLSIGGQLVKTLHPAGLLQDVVLIFGGLAVQYALARWRESLRAQKAVA